MDQVLVRDIRDAITLAYGLQRHEHVQHNDFIAEELGDLEKELLRIEAELGAPHPPRIRLDELEKDVESLEHLVKDVSPVVGAQIEALLDSVAKIEKRLARLGPSLEIPSKPLLGALPLARIVPQDVHSVLDYVAGLGAASALFLAETDEAKTAGLVLAAAGIGVSAMTDYRLGAVKAIPIEAHEAIDYAWGAAAIAAPFALGYHRRDPVAAAVHVAVGATTILMSLFTDYRAARGAGHGRRRRR